MPPSERMVDAAQVFGFSGVVLFACLSLKLILSCLQSMCPETRTAIQPTGGLFFHFYCVEAPWRNDCKAYTAPDFARNWAWILLGVPLNAALVFLAKRSPIRARELAATWFIGTFVVFMMAIGAFNDATCAAPNAVYDAGTHLCVDRAVEANCKPEFIRTPLRFDALYVPMLDETIMLTFMVFSAAGAVAHAWPEADDDIDHKKNDETTREDARTDCGVEDAPENPLYEKLVTV